MGIDIGWKHDTTGIQPLWCRDSEYRLLDQGVTLIRLGKTLHPDMIKSALYKLRERNPIHKVVMDVSNAEDIGAWIEDELNCEPRRPRPVEQVCLRGLREVHGGAEDRAGSAHGDRDLTRHVLNAISRPATYGDLRFDRPSQQRGSAKLQDVRVIDRLTAAAMVHTDAAFELAAAATSPLSS